MSELTPFINKNNVDSIRYGISLKKSSNPLLATQWLAEQTTTDLDHFPYSRWYRGVPQSSEPITSEREAGFRVRNDSCYRVNQCVPDKIPYPEHCFESACSTVYPCFQRENKLSLPLRCVPYCP